MEQAPDQEDIIQNQNHQLINPNPSKDAAKIANNFNNAVNLITNTRELNIPVFQYQKINIEPNQSVNLTYPDLGGCYTVTLIETNDRNDKTIITLHSPIINSLIKKLKELSSWQQLNDIQLIICQEEKNKELTINEILNSLNSKKIQKIKFTNITYDRYYLDPNHQDQKVLKKSTLNIKISQGQDPQIHFAGNKYSINGGERGI
jgi:hypothetical protein